MWALKVTVTKLRRHLRRVFARQLDRLMQGRRLGFEETKKGWREAT